MKAIFIISGFLILLLILLWGHLAPLSRVLRQKKNESVKYISLEQYNKRILELLEIYANRDLAGIFQKECAGKIILFGFNPICCFLLKALEKTGIKIQFVVENDKKRRDFVNDSNWGVMALSTDEMLASAQKEEKFAVVICILHQKMYEIAQDLNLKAKEKGIKLKTFLLEDFIRKNRIQLP